MLPRAPISAVTAFTEVCCIFSSDHPGCKLLGFGFSCAHSLIILCAQAWAQHGGWWSGHIVSLLSWSSQSNTNNNSNSNPILIQESNSNPTVLIQLLCLWCTQNCSQYYINPLNTFNIPRGRLFISLFPRRRHWDTERLSNSPNVTQLGFEPWWLVRCYNSCS